MKRTGKLSEGQGGCRRSPDFRHFCLLSWKPVLLSAEPGEEDPSASSAPACGVVCGQGEVAGLETCLPDLLPGQDGDSSKDGELETP